MGENNLAIDTAERCLRQAGERLESELRDEEIATAAFNLCLYEVRALIQSARRGDAYSKALTCRRMALDLSPSRNVHPESVREIMTQVDRDLKKGESGKLTIITNPPGCTIYVNSRRRGTTLWQSPQSEATLVLEALPPGAYSVQARCGSDEISRVHRVYLGLRPLIVRIDEHFDRAIHTDEMLVLHYETPDDQVRWRLAHALEVARTAQLTEIYLVSSANERGLVRVDRISALQKKVIASVLLQFDTASGHFVGDALSEAMELLVAGKSLNLAVAPVETMMPFEPPPGAPIALWTERKLTHAQKLDLETRNGEEPEGDEYGIWPKVLSGGGLLAVTASAGLWAFAYDGKASQTTLAYSVLGLALGGNTLLGYGLGLGLDSHESMPWWAWLSGGLGLGLGAAGFYIADQQDTACLVGEDSCNQANQPRRMRMLGVMIMSSSIPLLLVPFTQWLRLKPDRMTVSITIIPEMFMLGVQGGF